MHLFRSSSFSSRLTTSSIRRRCIFLVQFSEDILHSLADLLRQHAALHLYIPMERVLSIEKIDSRPAHAGVEVWRAAHNPRHDRYFAAQGGPPFEQRDSH